MLEEGHDFKDSFLEDTWQSEDGNWPFRPTPVGAFHGSKDVLEILLERLQPSDTNSLLLLVGGAIRGDGNHELGMIIRYFSLHSLTFPDLTNNYEGFYLPRHRNPKTFERILSLPDNNARIDLLDKNAVANKIQDLMVEAAQLGHVHMIRYFLYHGAKLFPWKHCLPDLS